MEHTDLELFGNSEQLSQLSPFLREFELVQKMHKLPYSERNARTGFTTAARIV